MHEAARAANGVAIVSEKIGSGQRIPGGDQLSGVTFLRQLAFPQHGIRDVLKS